MAVAFSIIMRKVPTCADHANTMMNTENATPLAVSQVRRRLRPRLR